MTLTSLKTKTNPVFPYFFWNVLIQTSLFLDRGWIDYQNLAGNCGWWSVQAWGFLKTTLTTKRDWLVSSHAHTHRQERETAVRGRRKEKGRRCTWRSGGTMTICPRADTRKWHENKWQRKNSCASWFSLGIIIKQCTYIRLDVPLVVVKSMS